MNHQKLVDELSKNLPSFEFHGQFRVQLTNLFSRAKICSAFLFHIYIWLKMYLILLRTLNWKQPQKIFLDQVSESGTFCFDGTDTRYSSGLL